MYVYVVVLVFFSNIIDVFVLLVMCIYVLFVFFCFLLGEEGGFVRGYCVDGVHSWEPTSL